MAGGFRRFLALLRKNGLQTIRSPGYLIGEIIVFALLFAVALLSLNAKHNNSELEKKTDPNDVDYESPSINRQFYDTSSSMRYVTLMMAKEKSVNKNDFDSFVRQLNNFGVKVKMADGSEHLQKKLMEEEKDKEIEYGNRSIAGFFIKELNNAKAKLTYEMVASKTPGDGLDLWNGWQSKHSDIFTKTELAWCQAKVNSAFYESAKKNKGVNVSKEVTVGSYEYDLKDAKVDGLFVLEMKNLIVMTMIVFTVLSIMHDNEHMKLRSRHLYSFPTALNLFGTANLRTIVPDGRITVNMHYFSANIKGKSSFAFLLTVLMALVFAALTEPLAEDVASGFMYQQILAGVPVWLYWTVEYLYASVLYSFQCAFYLATLCLTDELSGANRMRATLLAVVLFYSVWPIVCWLSHNCKSASTTTVTVAMWLTLGILAGFVLGLVLANTLGLIIKDPWTIEKAILIAGSIICPGLPFFNGLTKLNDIQKLESASNVAGENDNEIVSYFNLVVVIMAVMGTVHTLLFVLSRVKAARRGCSSKGKRDLIPPAVKQEEQNLTDEIVLEVNDLSKMFKKKCALADVSFKVQKQECFGLLGVSGAGKTTAFNIITGQMIPSEGGVTLDGVDIKTNIIVGLCPHIDTLQPSFKGKHSLAILAKVHGYRDVNGVVQKLIEMVDMEEHAGKGFNTCSGGQKRRLSVAAALLPRKSPFVILDEATAGIDPVARRDVWSVLSVVREHSAILMSSHSMEECNESMQPNQHPQGWTDRSHQIQPGAQV